MIKKILASPRYQRLAKEGGWILAGQIAAVLGSLVLVRVLTQYLEPAEYGQLALGLTVAGFVNAVIMGGVTNGIGRFYSIAAEEDDLSGYLRASAQLMVYATAAVVVIALALLIGLYWLGYSEWIGLATAALVFSLLSSYNTSLRSIQNAARQRAVIAIHDGLNAWLKIILAVCIMLLLGYSSTAVVMGYALSTLLVTGSQVFFLRPILEQSKDISIVAISHWVRRMLAFSWPFYAINLFGWAQQSSVRWALETYSTTENVGLYYVLSQLGYTPILMATGLLMTFISPIIFARTGDANNAARNLNVRNLTNKIAMLGMALTVLAFIVVSIFHSTILNVFVSEDYLSISHYLPWLVLSGGIFAVAQVYAIRMQALLMMDKLVMSIITISIIAVFLSFYGAYKAGLIGAIIASLIFSSTYLMLMFYWFFFKTRNVDEK